VVALLLDGDPADIFGCLIPECPLRAGHYTLEVNVIRKNELQDQILGQISFDVEDGVYRVRAFPNPNTQRPVGIDHVWKTPSV
jgi:hypothetical protein